MMNVAVTNPNLLSVENPTKRSKLHSNTILPNINNFFFSQTMKTPHHSKSRRLYSSHNKNNVRNSYVSTEPSTNIGGVKIRKDIYGNIIEKGGNQRISFKDNFKGKALVETTLINLKKTVKLKKKSSKNVRKDIEEIRAKDKDVVICSSACTIF